MKEKLKGKPLSIVMVVKILIWILQSYNFTISHAQNNQDLCDRSGLVGLYDLTILNYLGFL